MLQCHRIKASSASSHIFVASVSPRLGCIWWRESLEMKEHPLNPFSLLVMLEILWWHHLSGCKSPVSVLKSPETYPDTGTGQPWVLILLAGWRRAVFTHCQTGAWSMGAHEAAGEGYSSPTAWVITKTQFCAGSSRWERGRAGKKERQSCLEQFIH